MVRNPVLPMKPNRRVKIQRLDLPMVEAMPWQEEREKGIAKSCQAAWRPGLVEVVGSRGSWEIRPRDPLASTRRPGMIRVGCVVVSGGICPSRFISRCWQLPARSFCQVTARQSKRTIGD
jgi:hypothetical protein